MATQPYSGRVPAGALPAQFIPSIAPFPPMPAVARILSRFDRAKLGAAVEVLIALLDAAEADRTSPTSARAVTACPAIPRTTNRPPTRNAAPVPSGTPTPDASAAKQPNCR
jgi:hypothetical protein